MAVKMMDTVTINGLRRWFSNIMHQKRKLEQRNLRFSDAAGQLRAIALSWDPVLSGEVSGYVVERALAAEGPFERIGTVGGRFRKIHYAWTPDVTTTPCPGFRAYSLPPGRVERC